MIEKIAETAYDGENFDFVLCKRKPLTRLAVVTYLLLNKYNDYKAKEVSDNVIFDTFRDVSLRVKLYYKKTGRIGILKEDVIWFRHIMNVVIFKIGVLQFQPFEMIYLDEETVGEPFIMFAKQQKESLPSGAPVIKCHIQKDADLSPEAITESFNNAKHFFNPLFDTVQSISLL